jgi:hypothetical protein
VIISMVVSENSSEKSASIGETGERLKAIAVASFTSSNVASAGVAGANAVNVDDFILLITAAPSLLAKRTFIESVRTAAKIIVVAFNFSGCLLFDEAKICRFVGVVQLCSVDGGVFPMN